MTTPESVISDLITRVVEECKLIDADASYRDMLDECYSFDKVGGPFESMLPSRVLEECDPVAFRCGCNDYIDSEGWLEIQGDNYDADEVEKVRDTFIDELDSEISDLEAELDEPEADTLKLKLEIDSLTHAVKLATAHVF